MEQNTFVLYTNNQRFDQERFAPESPIVNEVATLNWPISGTQLTQYINIKQTELEDDENLFIALAGQTENNYNFFTLEESVTNELLDQNFYTMFKIVIRTDETQYTTRRSIFTFWTLLSEVGGLYGILFSGFSYVSSIFSFNKPENMIANELYRI